MADSKKKKKNVNNSNKSANKKSTTKKTSTGKKSNVSKKTTPKKSTNKTTTPKKKPNTKKNVKVEAKKATAKKSTTKKTTTKKVSTAKKNVKVETKKATVKKTSTKKVTPKKSTTKKTTPKKTTKKKISTTSVKVSPEQIDALTNVLEDKKITIKHKPESTIKKVKVEDLEPIKKAANSKKAKTKFKDSEQEKSIKIIDEAFKENEKEEIIAREVSEEEKPILLESYDIDNLKNSKINNALVWIVVLIIILILGIYSIMVFTSKYMTNSNNIDISYYESSDISYNLCSGDNCSGELSETNSSIDKANVSFKYDATFDEKTNYNVTYSISYKYEIFDDTKTYYSNNTQVDSKKIKDKKDSIVIDVDTEVNLAEYREKLKKYNEEKKLECNGSITAILKVSGIGKTKEVASLYIPLNDGALDRTIISSNMDDALFDNGQRRKWNGFYLMLIIVCILLVVMDCIAIMVVLNTSYDHLEDE